MNKGGADEKRNGEGGVGGFSSRKGSPFRCNSLETWSQKKAAFEVELTFVFMKFESLQKIHAKADQSWDYCSHLFWKFIQALVEDKQCAWMWKNIRAKVARAAGSFDSTKAWDGISSAQNVLTPSCRSMGKFLFVIGRRSGHANAMQRFSLKIPGNNQGI